MVSFLIEKKQTKTFEEKIKRLSVRTQQNVRASIHSFDRFCHEHYSGKTCDEILEELLILKDEEQTQATFDVLQNWIDWQYEQGSLTTGVKQYMSKIKKYFHHRGIKLHPLDMTEYLEYKPRIKEELYELTLEDIQKIFKVAPHKKIGLYLAQISTGARPGELLQVRKKDVDTTKKRIKIRIEAENVKTRAGRSGWLTKEAGKYLITKLRNLQDNDLVWAKNENPSYAEKNESTMFNKYADAVGLTDKYKSNGFRKITLYSFRSFFFGRAADVHREGYAHRMVGHSGYLSQYDRMSDDKKLEWFLELEPELTINQEERLRIKNELLTKEKSELEKKIPLLVDEAAERIKQNLRKEGYIQV